MAEALLNDSRYRVLQQFYTPGVYCSGKDTGFDGAEMTLFVWRELVESLSPPSLSGPYSRGNDPDAESHFPPSLKN
jgi:hypothetical protein